jgi:hypothetical protein
MVFIDLSAVFGLDFVRPNAEELSAVFNPRPPRVLDLHPYGDFLSRQIHLFRDLDTAPRRREAGPTRPRASVAESKADLNSRPFRRLVAENTRLIVEAIEAGQKGATFPKAEAKRGISRVVLRKDARFCVVRTSGSSSRSPLGSDAVALP